MRVIAPFFSHVRYCCFLFVVTVFVSGFTNDLEMQELRRLNERMMELQQARHVESARMEATVSELEAKADLAEKSEARQAEALAQASKRT